MDFHMSTYSERSAPIALIWLLLVIGGLLLLLSWWLLQREVQLRWQAIRELPGQVLGYESQESRCSSGSSKSRASYPCTLYRVQLAASGEYAGIPIEVHKPWSTDRPWTVGSQVTLLLQPDGKAWFCTWQDFIPGCLAGILGGLFLIFGIFGNRHET